ncbi:MAG: class I SAM-dependent methyltransferase [Capsulimonadales bacterium]|nr:class I SAM-dependent methyltransferase [Capsulimonadales bacterium]
MISDLRRDLLVTTALNPVPALVERALSLATELNASFFPRNGLSMPRLFEANPDARRVLVVRADRLTLRDPADNELFYHPNLSFLRLGNLLRGGNDLLPEAADLRPGDSVLDATLGYAAEAILCAHVVGPSGEVHGVEAVPELGVLVREGLQTVTTDLIPLNEAMRRIRVVHMGHHLDYLRACPDDRYDVLCFDPFFERVLEGSEHMMEPLRRFGDTSPLLPETIAEARRVARRRIVVKAPRSSSVLADLGFTETVGSRKGRVVYGIVCRDRD